MKKKTKIPKGLLLLIVISVIAVIALILFIFSQEAIAASTPPQLIGVHSNRLTNLISYFFKA